MGFGTTLKPSNYKKKAPDGSKELECFLKQVEEEILKQTVDVAGIKKSEFKESERSKQLRGLMKELKNVDEVVVPTDKTNSFKTMSVDNYHKEINLHLGERAVEIPRAMVAEIYLHCKDVLKNITPIISENEYNFLREKISSKVIPQPKVLIKDHKNADENGNYPTRLVVPATNFTAGFAKLGYTAIKNIFVKNNVKFGEYNIQQASELKEKLEANLPTKNVVTIASIDAVAMYPSIKFALIKKAVGHFAKKLPQEDLDVIEKAIEMVKLSMSNQLLSFTDKFYLYDGNVPVEQRGLTIGGFESAWFSDLVTAYLLDEMKVEIWWPIRNFCLYRDDGVAVFAGMLSTEEVNDWLVDFQNEVNRIAENDFLKFTATVWDCDGVRTARVGETETLVAEGFPFLDMELKWTDNNWLEFSVYLKPNQQLKYLNKESSHPHSCFKAIPMGVAHRLAKLTSYSGYNRHSRLDHLYPQHYQALDSANLIEDKSEIPELGQKKDEIDGGKQTVNAKTRKRRKFDQKRQIFFKLGYSNFWREPIHLLIEKIKANFPTLKWLRFSMSYHRFLNMRELFQGDLNNKLTKGLVSLDFEKLDCNCPLNKAKNEQCIYGGKCRTSIVVYKAICQTSGKFYIGNTQQKVKERIKQHVQDARRKFLWNQTSDTFASHFASMVPPGTDKSEVTDTINKNLKVEILWSGNPISCMKNFATKACKLCCAERIEILKNTRLNSNNTINRCSEIYGACRHKTRFHRFAKALESAASTDESVLDERGTTNHNAVVISTTSTLTTFSFDEGVEKRELGTPVGDSDADEPTKSIWELAEDSKAKFLIGQSRKDDIDEEILVTATDVLAESLKDSVDPPVIEPPNVHELSEYDEMPVAARVKANGRANIKKFRNGSSY